MLRILYVGLKNDYGDPKRGLCHEYVNFFDTLKRMKGVRAESFLFDEVMRINGREGMNKRLLESAEEHKPDICFFVLFTDEIKKETLRHLSERSGAATINWFTDDHWRFDLYSKFWAPLFNYVVTTDSDSVEKYTKIGYDNAILSQWGFNHFQPRPESQEYLHDISFIGQVHSTRRQVVTKLLHRNVNIECWGKGWKNGMLKSDDMRKKFVQSRINLNFTSSTNSITMKRLAKIFLRRRCDSSFHLHSPSQMVREALTLSQHHRFQIKGRNFEIPGHGGFLLSEYAECLEQYYKPGEEIALFRNFDELVEKISYYLNHDQEREKIRIAGQRRTLQDHTYQKRFEEIFRSIGILEKKGGITA